MEDFPPLVNKSKASHCITGNDTTATDTRKNRTSNPVQSRIS